MQYKRSPKKEAEQRLRLLNSLTKEYQPCSEVCKKANLLIGRGKELLEILRKEDKVEMKSSISGSYTYWKLRNTELENVNKGEEVKDLE